MHTHFKFKTGDVPTQYCPLDLYSKDEARMRKAIRDLWNGWMQSDGTLNNMKVFVSGKMVRPSEVRVIVIGIPFQFTSLSVVIFFSERISVCEGRDSRGTRECFASVSSDRRTEDYIESATLTGRA